MKPGSSQSKKDRLRKCEMASFLFAMSLCRRKAKPFAEMMKRISFIHLCAKERDLANGYIYLARCRRPASMRTDRRRSRTLLQYPTTLHQRKKPPGTNRAFRVWVFISKSRLERRGSKPRRPRRAISSINQACKCARYKDRGFCSPPINRTLILTEAISPL